MRPMCTIRTQAVKPNVCVGVYGESYKPCILVCMERKRLRPTYLRHWRQHRAKTLVQVAEELHLSHGQLSRIERGLQPYNQELLERLAELYRCEPVDLLIRDPSEPTSIWSIWDQAHPGERRQIASVAEALVRGRTGTEG